MTVPVSDPTGYPAAALIAILAVPLVVILLGSIYVSIETAVRRRRDRKAGPR